MHVVFVPEKNIAVNKNLNGDCSSIAINELRCGRAIYLNASAAADPGKRGALLASAETVSTAFLGTWAFAPMNAAMQRPRPCCGSWA